MKLIAKTFKGLEEVLADEIKAIGGEHVQIMNRAVSFKGSNRLIYKSNYCLRTAIRILKPIVEFEARDEDYFYRQLKKHDWSFYLKEGQTFAIDASVFGDYFTHSKYTALRCKDAIVDQFREKFGDRPDIDVNDPDLRLNVHISQKNVTVSIDTSGFSLFKRNYKQAPFPAPINEVLASGMLRLIGWNADVPLVDPMCGSGTFLMEAAMLAQNIPAGYHIEEFAFMKWDHFQPDLWKEVKSEADGQIELKFLKIYGSDIHPRAIRICQKMFGAHEYAKSIQIEQRDIVALSKPFEEGMLISNPPYGERLNDRETNELYRDIGDSFKQNFSGYQAWIISSNMNALKNVGLRPSRKISLYNGKLECKFQKYEMYSGSKKGKFIKSKQFD
ncbi:MAG: class I SAM-dependent RNA methyltransferase [Bacteroidota bacterium]